MKSIKMFETEDGKTFKTSSEAIDHETQLKFLKWYEYNKIRCESSVYEIGGKYFLEWIKKNKIELRKVFNSIWKEEHF